MAYDDIANDGYNPYKGQVFQSYDLIDVYNGTLIDYKGKSVNKNVFMSVLQGDKDAVKTLTGREGKVIESGPDDNVFVFISNHGSPGMVCWLDGNDMTAKELNTTITNMHKNNRYKNLVVYVDTCFAGSMFENILPDNIGVYAVTATDASNYAFSADCSSKAFSKSQTCLGGLFSINWVYELQAVDRTASSMDMQFQEGKTACQGKSEPQQYGDVTIARKKQAYFFGDSALYKKPMQSKRFRRSAEQMSVIPKHMLVYEMLKNKLDLLPEDSRESQKVTAELNNIKSLMSHADQFMKDIFMAIYGRFVTERNVAWAETNFGPINWSCYEPVVEAVRAQCPKMMNTEEVRYYAGAKFGVLVNLCNEVHTDSVLAAVKAAAKDNPLCGM